MPSKVDISKRKELLVNAVMHPKITRKFLKEFYEYGKKKSIFPEMPKEIKKEELGRWMLKNSKLPKEELLKELARWAHTYNILYTPPERLAKYHPDLYQLERSLIKNMKKSKPKIFVNGSTLSHLFVNKASSPVARTLALGEMAREMGLSVEYYIIPNLKKGLEYGHLGGYLKIDGKTYDVEKGKIGSKYEGKLLSRERMASTALANHAVALYERGKFNEALNALDMALELDERNPLALMTKAHLLNRVGNSEEALKLIEKAEKEFPEFEYIHAHKADILKNLGRYEEAHKIISKLIKELPKEHDMQYWLDVEKKEIEKLMNKN